MFSNKASVIVSHVVGWLLFFTLIVAFVVTGNEGEFKDVFQPNYLVFYVVYVLLFYFNSAFLIPKLYLEKKYGAYFIIAAVLLVVIYFLRPFDNLQAHSIPGEPHDFRPPPPDDREHRRGPAIDIISLVLFVLIFSFSATLEIIKEWRNTLQRAARAEADKANAELSFLKAQINPHFLFNTLNNIYSLAVSKSENTPDSILKLSNIMRYVTDEVNQDYVSLESEVQCISDYIDLQRLRLSDKVKVNFSLSGKLQGKRIAPLILMTFIENVFKYGTSNHEPAEITIELTADQNKISFMCRNKIFSSSRNVERTGIGIENTRQRLYHLYPGKHSLLITADDDFYTVQLTIEF